MENRVFDRIEKKYLITPSEKKKLLRVIKKHTKKDKYFKSTIINLYFDNDNYDLIIQSMDRPEFKEKIRVRSYEGYDRVFIEIKTKIKEDDYNVGYKRRIMITHKDFTEFANGKASLEELAARSIEKNNDLQIAKEADYLINYFNLKPKILLTYDRESYKGDNELRITFDENLSYRAKNLDLIQQNHDKIYFKDKHNVIMEIKTHGTIPLWLVEIMSKEKIYPQQFSKIGKVYERLRKEENV